MSGTRPAARHWRHWGPARDWRWMPGAGLTDLTSIRRWTRRLAAGSAPAARHIAMTGTSPVILLRHRQRVPRPSQPTHYGPVPRHARSADPAGADPAGAGGAGTDSVGAAPAGVALAGADLPPPPGARTATTVKKSLVQP
jgi:hypothetical protein